jgi:hypothetical protein
VQDILEIRALQLPVFPGGVALLDSEGRGQIQAIDVPVICGGTKVSPGELVFGDADGMLQVPQALEADVLRVAFERITASTIPCASCAAAPTFAMSTPWCDGRYARLLRLPRQHLEREARAAPLPPATGQVAAGRNGAQGQCRYTLRRDGARHRPRAALRGHSIGVGSDDETTAAPVAKYPDKFVGFAYVDPRRADRMELLRHAVEDLRLKGAKFGPIYNGVARSDTRV